MAQTSPIPQRTKARVVSLVRGTGSRPGISIRAAAAKVGISHTSAQRILAESDSQPPPFSGGRGPAHVPEPAWDSDQPPPARRAAWDPNYHGHTFQSFAAPLSFDGWSLPRIRRAISMHRQGYFYESSTLAIVLMSFGPVFAATGQRLAPALALPRHIKCGSRGLSKRIGREIEQQLVPQQGLLPSPYFPPTLYGAIGFDLLFMGFSVLQHVDGKPDPETGIRPRYTRRWPTWATQYYRSRKTFVALTNDGPVDIRNDGKFTLIADTDEPHFLGAIVALGEEVFDGKATQRGRASWIDKYCNPKWVGKMPPGVAPRTPEGDAFEQAIATIRSPDGFGVLPNGSDLQAIGLTAQQSTVLKDALESNWMFVAAIMLGSDGTMTRGTGVYSAPVFAGVRRDLVDRDVGSTVRGINQGHVEPYVYNNYSSSIAEANDWQDPVLESQMPDPDSDKRIESYANRVKKLHESIKAERDSGCVVDQDRINQLADRFEVDAPTLADIDDQVIQIDLAPTDKAKVVTVNEARRSMKLEPLVDERGDKMLAEIEQKKENQPDENSGKGEPEKTETADDAQPGASEGASEMTDGGGTSTGGETKPSPTAPANENERENS